MDSKAIEDIGKKGVLYSVSFADVVHGEPILPVYTKERLKKELVAHFTLNSYKLYLDSCATYHSICVDWYLHNIKEVGTILHGNYNAGVTITNKRGT